MYVTLKPVKTVFGLVQETAREYSVTLLKTSSVGGSGPEKRKQGDILLITSILIVHHVFSACYYNVKIMHNHVIFITNQ